MFIRILIMFKYSFEKFNSNLSYYNATQYNTEYYIANVYLFLNKRWEFLQEYKRKMYLNALFST